jgi:1-acyl-sn-glycerol-3-phosphate acyltransferase
MKILYFSGWELSRILSRFVFRVRVSGRENIPKSGGFILASNHISYFDPPLVGCWVPRAIYFFAKKELFDHKLFGAILRRVNALPVKRGAIDRKALEMAIETVKRGHGLAVFPEGTRSKTGEFMTPKLGVGMIARQSECPIVPAYLSGADRLNECLRRRRKLCVTYGGPLSVEWVTSFPADKAGYLKIAEAVMASIGQLRDSMSVGSASAKQDYKPTQK